MQGQESPKFKSSGFMRCYLLYRLLTVELSCRVFFFHREEDKLKIKISRRVVDSSNMVWV